MTRRNARAHQQRRTDSKRDIPIPHSSWSQWRPATAGELLTPEDFWSRLGL